MLLSLRLFPWVFCLSIFSLLFFQSVHCSRIRDELNNQYETEEEKEQAVLVALEENLERLRSACTALVDTLCDENSPVQPPYEVRAAAHLIAQCARAYQTDPVPLIGGFIILR